MPDSPAPVSLPDLVQHTAERAGEEPLAQLEAAVALAAELETLADTLLNHFVLQARATGSSWAAVGGALGVSRQAAQQRWAARRAPTYVDLLAWTELERKAPLDRFAAPARQAIAAGAEEARRRGHAAVGPAHLLWGLVQEAGGLVTRLLAALGADPALVAGRVLDAVEQAEQASPAPLFDPQAKKVLEQSLRAARTLGRGSVGTSELLLGLLAEGQSTAAKTLEIEGLVRDAVRQAVQEGSA